MEIRSGNGVIFYLLSFNTLDFHLSVCLFFKFKYHFGNEFSYSFPFERNNIISQHEKHIFRAQILSFQFGACILKQTDWTIDQMACSKFIDAFDELHCLLNDTICTTVALNGHYSWMRWNPNDIDAIEILCRLYQNSSEYQNKKSCHKFQNRLNIISESDSM